MHSTASSTDSEDCDENYVPMVSNMSTDEPVCNTQLSPDLTLQIADKSGRSRVCVVWLLRLV